jgi:hypothetical protein
MTSGRSSSIPPTPVPVVVGGMLEPVDAVEAVPIEETDAAEEE